MEKRRQIEAINGEFQLPVPIIHRVQSFLTAKEAARSAFLSKSWCSAWSTRPIIDLDIYEIYLYYELNEFMELVKKTIQRYEQSNLKIESFRLNTQSRLEEWGDADSDLANDLVKRALKIGATHLSIKQGGPRIVLPHEVFEAENLVELSVEWCTIDDLGLDRKVRCSKLKSLSLNRVTIHTKMISNITSCCPLIEKLSLRDISCFNGSVVNTFVVGYVSHCLFLGDLSSKYPNLKDLTLELQGCNEQVVSSHSLERLSYFIPRGTRICVKFDVPSIRKFRYEGHDIPSLSFVSSSREWESSDVFLTNCCSGLKTLWFRRLNKFLNVLNLSRISLSIEIPEFKAKNLEYEVGDIQDLPKPEVENLTIKTTDLPAMACFALFHGLFRICRPKLINVDYEPFERWTTPTKDLLCKTLARGFDDKCMFGLHDIGEVKVQLFDKDIDAWCSLTLESLLDASTSPKEKAKICFQLKWKT